VRLAGGLVQGAPHETTLLDQPAVMEHFTLMARHGLVATIEATSDQLGVVTRLTRDLPDLKVVLDHFGWPSDLSDAGRRIHLDRLAELAARPNVATRLDAVGTIFGAWTAKQVRPWLFTIVALFGPGRCMLGSDLPIERLRSGFEPLYRAYEEIFAGHTRRDREMLLRATAEHWYGTG
jgi:predicted TIM-barrel fold metal-dependent hydrolase